MNGSTLAALASEVGEAVLAKRGLQHPGGRPFPTADVHTAELSHMVEVPNHGASDNILKGIDIDKILLSVDECPLSLEEAYPSSDELSPMNRTGVLLNKNTPLTNGKKTGANGRGRQLNGGVKERGIAMTSDRADPSEGRGGPPGEEELASRTLHIQSKRFYLDVKQNKRGRFIKFAEVDAGGRKNRLLFAMSTAGEFRDKLTEFSEHYASLGPQNASTDTTSSFDAGKLKSETIMKDDRRYYLDLKENQRGRFLRVSMTLSVTRQRFQVVIPAQGMIEVRNALTDLLKEFGSDCDESAENLPEAQSLRVDNKMFYFDVGQNNRGTFLRISEVRLNFRDSVTIPEQSWGLFRDTMSMFIKQQDQKGGLSAKEIGGGPAGEAATATLVCPATD